MKAVVAVTALVLVALVAGCTSESSAPAATPRSTRSTTTIDPNVDPTVVDQPPVVPRIDAAMQARLRAVVARGRTLGNRPDVFAKIGDSITAITDFLVPVGCGQIDWGSHGDLAPVVDRWSKVSVAQGWIATPCGRTNSFTRAGSAMFPGWTTQQLLTRQNPRNPECQPPADIPVRCEMLLIRPSVALVMIGSNDTVEPNGLADYRRDLPKVVRAILAEGVVPVLSTIPPRLNPPSAAAEVPKFNAVVREVAAAEGVPLWNYWLQLHDKRHYGLSYDLLHPAPAPKGGGDFTEAGLAYGFNLRNLGALEVLRKVQTVVLDDGPADP